MRVLVVSQYYPPENVPLPAAIARGLRARGHEVRVLTGYPNYPDGRVFEGYQQHWRSRERDGGVEVLRVPLFPDHSQAPFRRALNYGSFGLSAAIAGGFSRGADVVYVYATQMTAAFGPWLWSLIGGAPYVLHVQDLWPDSITGSSLVGRRARLVNAVLTPWLASAYGRASAVIGIAPTMVRTLVERGVPEAKAHLVYNWAERSSGASVVGSAESNGGPTTNLLYAGNVGDMQDLETVVRAVHACRDAGVRLTIAGEGVALPRVRALVTQLKANNVILRGRVPLDRVDSLHSEADFALVSLKDMPAFYGTIPSKFQTALANGVPVISTVPGDLSVLVESLGVGLTADPASPGALEAVLRHAAGLTLEERTHLHERSRAAHIEHFSEDAAIVAIERILMAAYDPER